MLLVYFLLTLVSSEIECDNYRYIGVYDDTGYVSWQEALQYCQDEVGTQLASIHNDSDNAAALNAAQCTGANVSNVTSINGGDSIWIGLNDTQSEGTFGWVDGTSLDYSNWAPGNPSASDDNKDCVDYTAAQWHDRTCNGTDTEKNTVWVCNRLYGMCCCFFI